MYCITYYTSVDNRYTFSKYAYLSHGGPKIHSNKLIICRYKHAMGGNIDIQAKITDRYNGYFVEGTIVCFNAEWLHYVISGWNRLCLQLHLGVGGRYLYDRKSFVNCNKKIKIRVVFQ